MNRNKETILVTAEQLYGRISFLLGFISSAVAVGFACFIPGLDVERVLESPHLFENAWFPLGFALAALLFQFGIPFFCMASFFFGMRARGCRTARIGMILAAISLLGYGIYTISWLRLING